MSGFNNTTIVNKIMTMLTPSARSVAETPDPTNTGRVQSLDIREVGGIEIGVIVRAGAGTYDYDVVLAGRTLVCIGMMTSGGDSTSYPEGSHVLVHVPASVSEVGVVIGAVPRGSILPDGGVTSPPVMGFADNETNIGLFADPAYISPHIDPNDDAALVTNEGRPTDLVPGAWGHINHYGAGAFTSGPAATLRGSAGASVRVSGLDDQVRIVSGHYQHFGPVGVEEAYNDCGYTTSEFNFTMYQGQRAGALKTSTPVMRWKGDGFSTASTEDKENIVDSIKEKTIPRRVLTGFVGFLGDIVNLFIGKPDPDIEIETAEDDPKDQGLMSFQVGASGRVHLRSAAGVMLERWDRIPVPKRKFHPGDPEGDKISEAGDPEKQIPYEFPDDDPYARSLLLRDAEAWRSRSDYLRLHERSQSVGAKDMYLPEEDELEVPDDDYDEFGEENFEEYDKRKAFMGIEPDGSIIMRDAWGSEIVMRGGSIIITGARQIDIRSGKSTVITAGDDVIVKARKSADISATEHDVRIKAEKNLQMVGKGIIAESTATANTPGGGGDKEGEDADINGIVLSAPKSRVFSQGKTVHQSASRHVILETLPAGKGKNNKGSIYLSTGHVYGAATKDMVLTAGPDIKSQGSLLLRAGSGMLAGPSAYLLGANQAHVVRAAEVLTGEWVDVGENQYDIVSKAFSELAKTLRDDKWTGGYGLKSRDGFVFKFRTSEQCGTEEGIDHDMDDFKVYQPFWAFWAGTAEGKERVGDVESWEEKPVNETYPWPGKDTYEKAGAYMRLPSEKNIDPSTGLPRHRKDLTEQPMQLKKAKFEEFEVLK